jgi:hypothetical protein
VWKLARLITYGATDVFGGEYPMNFSMREQDDDVIYAEGWSGPSGAPQGSHFLKLDNDGCLRGYDQDGARWTGSPYGAAVSSNCS